LTLWFEERYVAVLVVEVEAVALEVVYPLVAYPLDKA
jgi:hypothetical protein